MATFPRVPLSLGDDLLSHMDRARAIVRLAYATTREDADCDADDQAAVGIALGIADKMLATIGDALMDIHNGIVEENNARFFAERRAAASKGGVS